MRVDGQRNHHCIHTAGMLSHACDDFSSCPSVHADKMVRMAYGYTADCRHMHIHAICTAEKPARRILPHNHDEQQRTPAGLCFCFSDSIIVFVRCSDTEKTDAVGSMHHDKNQTN